MDKQRKERISIRINGKEKNLLSEDELNKEIAASSEPLPENDKFEQPDNLDNVDLDDHETNIIDFEEVRLERGYKKNVKKRKLSALPSPRSKLPKKKKRRTPLLQQRSTDFSVPKKLLGALLSAIIIGTGFGYVVLSLFTDISDGSEPATNHVQQVVANNINQGQPNNQPVQATGGAETTITEIQAMNFQVIQGGAFSSTEAANQFASNLTENGKAAVIVPDSNPALMFIGIGTNRNEINSISQYYRDQGQEIYIKAVDTPSVAANLIDESQLAFIHNGQALYQSLSAMSTQAFATSSIDENEWANLEQSFSSWESNVPEGLPETLKTFSNSVTNAYQAIAAYNSTQTDLELWKSQQALLEGYIAYDKWVSSKKE